MTELDKWDGDAVVPYNCPCCVKCWLFVEGKLKGRCAYRGPYLGYIQMPEKPLDANVEN